MTKFWHMIHNVNETIYSLLRIAVMKGFPPKISHKINVFKNTRISMIEPELEVIPLLLSKDMISIDVGAHLGLFVDAMSKGSAKVLAFEPQFDLCIYLKKLHFDNVEIFNLALSNTCGFSDLRIPQDLRTSSFMEAYASIEPENAFTVFPVGKIQTTRVPKMSLNALNIKPVSVALIKIDVEGHELSVLQGATQIISEGNPVLIVEISYQHNSKWENVFEFLAKFEYCAYKLNKKSKKLVRFYSENAEDHDVFDNYIFFKQDDLRINQFI